MKGKYITTKILLACMSKPAGIKKDIRTQLAETIAQRRKLIEQWELLIAKPYDATKDIHAQLADTIKGLKGVIQHSRKSISPEQNQSFVLHDKKAA